MRTADAAALDALTELLRRDGPDVLDQPDRCAAWLRYAMSEQKREANVLLAALQQGVPQQLREGADRQTLVRRLVDEMAMNEDAARWAVEIWAAALHRWLEAKATSPAPVLNGCQQQTTELTRTPTPNRPLNLGPLPSADGEAVALTEPQRPERRQDVLHGLAELQAGHDAVRKAAEQDITSEVTGLGSVLAIVGGLAGWYLGAQWGSGFDSQRSLSVVLGVMGAIAGFVGIYLSKRWEVATRAVEQQRKLEPLLQRFIDAFPAEVCAWGGPHVLEDERLVRHLLCAVKAGQPLSLAPRTATPPRPIAPAHTALPHPVPHQPANHSITPNRGSTIMALGICGWFLPILAPLAWYMGHTDTQAIAAGHMQPDPTGQTNTGKILGMIATLLYGAILFLALVSSRH